MNERLKLYRDWSCVCVCFIYTHTECVLVLKHCGEGFD